MGLLLTMGLTASKNELEPNWHGNQASAKAHMHMCTHALRETVCTVQTACMYRHASLTSGEMRAMSALNCCCAAAVR